MDGEELEQRAIEAYMNGRDGEAVDLFGRAHASYVASREIPSAARAAFRAGMVLLNNGERAPAAGWLARCRRLVDEAGEDCAARGYLLLPQALEQVGAADFACAHATFAEAAAIGRRFEERDLTNLAMQGAGRSLIALGRCAEGLALLDEAMVAATTGELSPVITGIVYCGVLSACFDIQDVRRAQEWTAALSEWCAAQPEVVPFRGECLARRAEIMAIHGEWRDALAEAQRAADPASRFSNRAAKGAAEYLVGEIFRVRGEFRQAEEAYLRAVALGRSPHPGLALLRLAEGDISAAHAALAPVLAAARLPTARSRLLPASIEIAIAAGDLEGAAASADELADIVRIFDQPWLHATAADAAGRVALARRDPGLASVLFRQASDMWRDLQAPYQRGRAMMWLATACQDAGDLAGARMELAAAARILEDAGASVEAARAASLLAACGQPVAGPLTRREAEVLKLIAKGMTNRAIAAALDVSEKTVARHVSNIFDKLDVSTRAAATAYAFRHGLA